MGCLKMHNVFLVADFGEKEGSILWPEKEMQQRCTMQGSLAFCEWAITGEGGPYIVQPTVYKSIHKPRI